MTRSIALAGGLLAVGILIGACGGDTATTTAAPTASLLPPASGTPTGASAILVDETLLDYLPVQVGGIALERDPDTAGNIASDPDLAERASAIGVAFAISPGASTADDVAVVSVVRLRSDVFDDAFFRSWRDSYDAAACEAAGGVDGHAEAEIDGRTTYIGTCAAGAHTYHVYLDGPNVIVSVTSVGEGRFGEQIVAGLRE